MKPAATRKNAAMLAYAINIERDLRGATEIWAPPLSTPKGRESCARGSGKSRGLAGAPDGKVGLRGGRLRGRVLPLSHAPLYTVIMAGGAGTRFWPASRADRPKQLLPLAGGERAPHRGHRPAHPAPLPRRAGAGGHRRHLIARTRAALPELPAANFLAEPAPRNTAPCIGWAATTIRRRDPEAMVMVLPSDHFIADEEGFRAALLRAAEAAKTSPHRHHRDHADPPRDRLRVHREAASPSATGAFAVTQFIEKPDLARAESYVASGKHLWNSGMFFFRAQRHDRPPAHAPAGARRVGSIASTRAALGDEEAEARECLSHAAVDQHRPRRHGESRWGRGRSRQLRLERRRELAERVGARPKTSGQRGAADCVLVDARGNLVSDLRSRTASGSSLWSASRTSRSSRPTTPSWSFRASGRKKSAA